MVKLVININFLGPWNGWALRHVPHSPPGKDGADLPFRRPKECLKWHNDFIAIYCHFDKNLSERYLKRFDQNMSFEREWLIDFMIHRALVTDFQMGEWHVQIGLSIGIEGVWVGTGDFYSKFMYWGKLYKFPKNY